MNDDVVPPEGAVKDIVLNEIDRDIVRMAARLLMALDPGETREIAALDHPKTALMRLRWRYCAEQRTPCPVADRACRIR